MKRALMGVADALVGATLTWVALHRMIGLMRPFAPLRPQTQNKNLTSTALEST
jgi:hypothetical protein